LAGGRNIQAGDVVVYDSSPKSRTPAPPQIADFVFLIETGKNKNCLRGQHLLDLPAKIDTVLRATHGINSTKFALLTFGAGKPYSVHTLDGSIWSGRRGIQSALAKYLIVVNLSYNQSLKYLRFAVYKLQKVVKMQIMRICTRPC